MKQKKVFIGIVLILLLWGNFTLSAQNNSVSNIRRYHFREENLDNWGNVYLYGRFNSPIVVTGIPTYYDTEPFVIRMKNLSDWSFNIRMSEWQYQDKAHKPESVDVLIYEEGVHNVDGVTVEAGKTVTNQNWTKVNTRHTFKQPPVVLTQCASYNDSSPVVTRIRNVTLNSFEVCLQEEEGTKDQGVHLSEEIHYILFEQHKNAFIVNNVTDAWKALPRPSGTGLYSTHVFGAMQTANSPDTCSLRQLMNKPGEVDIKIQEENSRDAETAHTGEQIGIFQLFMPHEFGDVNFDNSFDIGDVLEIGDSIIGKSPLPFLGSYFEYGDFYKDGKISIHDIHTYFTWYIGFDSSIPKTPEKPPIITPNDGDGDVWLTASPSINIVDENFSTLIHLKSTTQHFCLAYIDIIYDNSKIIFNGLKGSNNGSVDYYAREYASDARTPYSLKIILGETPVPFAPLSPDLLLMNIEWKRVPGAMGTAFIFILPKTIIDKNAHDYVNVHGSIGGVILQ